MLGSDEAFEALFVLFEHEVDVPPDGDDAVLWEFGVDDVVIGAIKLGFFAEDGSGGVGRKVEGRRGVVAWIGEGGGAANGEVDKGCDDECDAKSEQQELLERVNQYPSQCESEHLERFPKISVALTSGSFHF